MAAYPQFKFMILEIPCGLLRRLLEARLIADPAGFAESRWFLPEVVEWYRVQRTVSSLWLTLKLLSNRFSSVLI